MAARRSGVGAEAVAPGDVDVLPHDLFEVSRDSRVREEVVGHARGEIDEQVHIAVGSVLRTHDRAEHRDVDNAALTKFDFVGAELREDVREERHRENLLPRWLAYNTPTRQLGSFEREARGCAAKALRSRHSTLRQRLPMCFLRTRRPAIVSRGVLL